MNSNKQEQVVLLKVVSDKVLVVLKVSMINSRELKDKEASLSAMFLKNSRNSSQEVNPEVVPEAELNKQLKVKM